MNPLWVFAALLVLGGIWTALLVWVTRRRPPTPYAELAPRVQSLRKRLVYPVLGVVTLAFILSLGGLAYPANRIRRLGEPQALIEVRGAQWAWTLSRRDVPAGVPVEFRVTAQDVNHGLGIYSADGRLIAQVQAMPRYTNRLIVSLPQPGTYTLRCLEYCGVLHHAMTVEITAREAGTR
jgi:cytochrome c oxidase subunit 2